MLQPTKRKPLDLSGANEILEERKPLDLSGAESILKKKESSKSTIPTENSDSVPIDGSLATQRKKQKSSSFPEIDMNNVAPGNGVQPSVSKPEKKYEEGTMAWNHRKMIENNPDYVNNYNRLKDIQKVDDAKKEKIIKDTEEEFNGSGIWNNVKSLGKKAINAISEPTVAGLSSLGSIFSNEDSDEFVKSAVQKSKIEIDPFAEEKQQAKNEYKQAVKTASLNKTPIPKYNPEEINKRALQIKIDNRIKSESDTQLKDYLKKDEETGSKDKTKFITFESGKYATLKDRDKELLQKQNIERNVALGLKGELEDLQKDISTNGLNEDNRKQYLDKYQKYQDVVSESIKTHEEYADNRKDLGDSSENLDVFKRDYGSLKSFLGNIDATLTDLSAGGLGTIDYALESTKGITGFNPKEQNIIRGAAEDLKSDADKIRSEIMKPISVDNINNWSDFGDWFFQTAVAQQVPIYGLLATGNVGVGAIGGTSLGNKFEDMQAKIKSGEENYSTAELMLNPIGYGVAETASAMVDRMLLKNAGRVISSASQPERQMIAQGFAKRVLDATKNLTGSMAKGAVYEGLDEGLTQGFENLIDGKPFLDNIKDPIVAGAVMGAVIPLGGQIIAQATKPFSTDTQIQNLASEITRLRQELNNPELSNTARSAIQEDLVKQQSKLRKSVGKIIGDIEGLSEQQFEEIVKSETTMANIKDKAIEIRIDDTIDDSMKNQLLGNLREEFDATNQRRLDLLSKTKNDYNSISDSEKKLLREQSIEELNTDYDKNINLSEQEIEKKSKEIYNRYKNIDKTNVEIRDYKSSSDNRVFDTVLKSDDGSTLGVMSVMNRNNVFEVNYSELYSNAYKGKGIGYLMYKSMIDEANRRGIEVYSDSKSLSKDAQEVWERLEKDGLAEKVRDIDGNPEQTYRKKFPQFKTILTKKNNINEANTENISTEIESQTEIQESKNVQKEHEGSELLKEKIKDIELRRQEELKNNNANGLIPINLDLNLPENKKFLEKKNKQDNINSKYDSELNSLKESFKNNEESPKPNTNDDAGVRTGTESVDEVRVAEQENIIEEQVSESVEPRTSEAETKIDEEKKSALKNADIAKKRKELGLEEREKVTRKKSDELVDSANKKIKEGYDTEELIDDILDSNSNRTLTDEEVVILKQYQLAKENRLLEIGEEIVNATNEGKSNSKLNKLIEEREQLVNDIDKAYRAGEQSGIITARALQARRLAMMQDYSLANMLIQKRKAIGDQKLSPEQIQEVSDEYAKIKKLREELEQKILNLEKEKADLKAGTNIEKLAREERKSKRKSKTEEIDSDIKSTMESLRKKLREQAGRMSANAIPVEMIPEIAKLAQLYVKKGIVKLDDIVDEIHSALKDVSNLSKEDIKEIIGDYNYDLDSENENRLARLKKRTKEKIEELRGRLAKQDFEKKQNTPVKLDEEAKKLKDELRQAKFDWDKALEKDILARRQSYEKIRDGIAEILNLPRSVMASIDFSAPLRQGLVLTVSNPVTASKAFIEMFRQAVSQKRFDRWLEDLKETPQYEVMKDSGLYIADNHSAKLSAKEEQFMSNLANKIPIIGKGFEAKVGGKKVKLGGLDLIGGSERAYVSYLNKLRTDIFAKTADAFEKEGYTVQNKPELYKALGKYINSATGRGDLGGLNESAGLLNSLFFSPRLIASRINLLTNWANPIWLINTPAKVKQMYALDMFKLVSVGVTLLTLASLGGADVEDDPRSSDFGKIRSGNQRWDMWGGFQQFVRFFSQFYKNQRKTASGQIKNLGEGFNSDTRADLFWNMVRSKMAPVPGTAWNLMDGKNMVGEEYTLKDVPKSFLPLFASDLYKAIERDGATKGVIETGIPAVFGVGVQNYETKPSKSGGKYERQRGPKPPSAPTP